MTKNIKEQEYKIFNNLVNLTILTKPKLDKIKIL